MGVNTIALLTAQHRWGLEVAAVVGAVDNMFRLWWKRMEGWRGGLQTEEGWKQRKKPQWTQMDRDRSLLRGEIQEIKGKLYCIKYTRRYIIWQKALWASDCVSTSTDLNRRSISVLFMWPQTSHKLKDLVFVFDPTLVNIWSNVWFLQWFLKARKLSWYLHTLTSKIWTLSS